MDTSSPDNSLLIDPSRFRVNTEHFSPHDLALFVDSMETISQLNKSRVSFPIISWTFPGSDEPISSVDQNSIAIYDQPRKDLVYSQWANVSESAVNHTAFQGSTYFAALNNDSGQSSAESETAMQEPYKRPSTSKRVTFHTTPSSTSDSDESGMFPRDKVISSADGELDKNTPSPTFLQKSRLRLIGFTPRRESSPPAVNLLSCRMLNEDDNHQMQLSNESILQQSTSEGSTRKTIKKGIKKISKMINKNDNKSKNIFSKALRHLSVEDK